MWRLLSVLVFVNVVRASTLRNEGRSFSIYETPESIMSFGYPAERHQVVTSDGYILEMHRIPRGRNQDDNTVRPVVFLMHGLLSSSNSFVAIGPNSGVAYNLADAGFDVWMGNARGTRNSRSHTTLNPDDDVEKFQFFDFSWEEIGMIDVAAMIDYALSVTGQTTLHYIGHSQGGTVFLVLASMRPEYNAKLKSVHLLAGVGYMNYFPDTEVIDLAVMTDFIYALSLMQGVVEVYPPNENETAQFTTTTHRVLDLCTGNVQFKQICTMLGLKAIMTRADDATNQSEFHIGGASLKQIAHYGQNIRDKAFRRWNYGAAQNQQVYGDQQPPVYNLNLITSNVTMHYTISDNLLDERDVLAMAADMPNAQVRKVARDSFLHGDFVATEDSKELVTDYIINAIRCVENSPQCDTYVAPGSSSNIVLNVLLKTFLLGYSVLILNGIN